MMMMMVMVVVVLLLLFFFFFFLLVLLLLPNCLVLRFGRSSVFSILQEEFLKIVYIFTASTALPTNGRSSSSSNKNNKNNNNSNETIARKKKNLFLFFFFAFLIPILLQCFGVLVLLLSTLHFSRHCVCTPLTSRLFSLTVITLCSVYVGNPLSWTYPFVLFYFYLFIYFFCVLLFVTYACLWNIFFLFFFFFFFLIYWLFVMIILCIQRRIKLAIEFYEWWTASTFYFA